MNLNELYRAYLSEPQAGQDALLRAVVDYASSMAQNDDVGQQIAIDVWMELPGLKIEKSFASWLYNRCYWTIVEHYRKRKESQLPIVHSDDGSTLTADDTLDLLQPSDDEYSLPYIEDDYIRTVAYGILRGYTLNEIAEQLNTTEAAIKQRIKRQRASLSVLQQSS